jgi:L-fucose mutarotase
MASADGAVLDIQRELMAAARVDESGARFVDRYDFYDAAASAFLIIRTGETRIYGNALLRKGLASPTR